MSAKASGGIAAVESGGFGPLLDGIAERYGYDFRGYARPWLDRRIRTFMKEEGLPNAEILRAGILDDSACMLRFIGNLSVGVPSMFRDPAMFAAIRKEVIPALRTFPFIRIWQPGCATGQEAYSLAILMQEEGLYDRCRIYATDIDDAALRAAKEGIFPLPAMRRYTANYFAAGGKSVFSDYYTANYGNAIINAGLRKNIVFANHNLVSDGSFNEFQIILCRNLLGCFSEGLQKRVHGLFHQSLAMFGYLGLGPKESIAKGGYADAYQETEAGRKLYRKIA